MADGLAGSHLGSPALPRSTRIDWVETVGKPDQPMSLPSRKLIDAWTAQGIQVAAQTVACPMIWQVHERAAAPELVAATLRAFEGKA
jgi:hypothetical protein